MPLVALSAFFHVFVAPKAFADGARGSRVVLVADLWAILFPPTTHRRIPFFATYLLVNLSGATRALRRRWQRHRPPSPLFTTMKEHRQHEVANVSAANRQSSRGTQESDGPPR